MFTEAQRLDVAQTSPEGATGALAGLTTTAKPLTLDPVFTFAHENQRHPMRCVQAPEGHLWFVAQDICRALELTNTARALSRLDADEKGVTSMNTIQGSQTLSTVNEAGLYALILRSRKPAAKVFKRWVTHDVLPAIRRDGLYIQGEELLLTAATPDQLRARLQMIEATAAQGIEAKAVRGLNGLEERQARYDAFQFLKGGRRRSKRQ